MSQDAEASNPAGPSNTRDREGPSTPRVSFGGPSLLGSLLTRKESITDLTAKCQIEDRQSEKRKRISDSPTSVTSRAGGSDAMQRVGQTTPGRCTHYSKYCISLRLILIASAINIISSLFLGILSLSSTSDKTILTPSPLSLHVDHLQAQYDSFSYSSNYTFNKPFVECCIINHILNTSCVTEEPRVLPCAEAVWKQARAAFIQCEKMRLRAHRLHSWAEEGLLPKWTVGEGPIPAHLMQEPELPALLGEIFARQGAETLRILADSLLSKSANKLEHAESLLKAVCDIYGEDEAGIDIAKDKIDSFVKKERALTIKQLEYQEAKLRQVLGGPEAAFRLRNPVRNAELPAATNTRRRSTSGSRDNKRRRRANNNNNPARTNNNNNTRAVNNNRGNGPPRQGANRRRQNTPQTERQFMRLINMAFKNMR